MAKLTNDSYNQTYIYIYTINWRSTIHMTLKMTSAQVVETSVIVTNKSSFQNYTNPDDHTQQTTGTPGFKPFTVLNKLLVLVCWSFADLGIKSN